MKILSLVFINVSLDENIEKLLDEYITTEENIYVEPFNETWKKVLAVSMYLAACAFGAIPLFMANYERRGNHGHYRTEINQIFSWTYFSVIHFKCRTFA